MTCLALLLNIFWALSGGLVLAAGFALVGIACCVTVVGIPFGLIAFKMAALAFTPFGTSVVYGGGVPSALGNVAWLLLCGWWAALVCVLEGLVFCVTIIGIPFGIQLFKFAKLMFWPFGTVVR